MRAGDEARAASCNPAGNRVHYLYSGERGGSVSDLQFLKEARLDGRVEWGVPMAALTTLRVGGPAEAVVFAGSEADVRLVVRLCRENGAELTIFGRGSNLLVRDGGLRGVALCLGREFAQMRRAGAEILAQAGAALPALSRAARDAGLSGLEFAEGIPGSVGGAVAMNAGAYGGEIAQVLRSARVLFPDGEVLEVENAGLDFSYRSSALQREGLVCLGARFSLQAGDAAEISARMADFAGRRREKQPLQLPSAGSFFKRPPGDYAGRLIEEAGLKGAREGGAQVSPQHAGFFVNAGGATAGDFLALMERVQRAVYERSGVRLEPEVRILGQDAAGEGGRQ